MTTEEREEIKRHFDVVAEGLRSDIRLVADGVAIADGHIGRLETKVDGLETKIDRVDRDVKALTKETREGFRELRARVGRLEAEIAS
jgi:hypothetical protein